MNTFKCACDIDDCHRGIDIAVRTDGTLSMVINNPPSAIGIRVGGADLLVLAREALIAYHMLKEYQQH